MMSIWAEQESPESLNYKKAYNYSLEVGKSLTEALREKARSDMLPDGRMYYNIADKALRPMLENNYRLISDYCVKTQNALNERAGIGIKGVAAPINEDRVNGLLNVAAAAQQFDDVVGELCRECETYSLSVVDEHIRKNAEVQNSAGLSPKIERYCGHSGCDWCSSLAGTYEYEKVKDTGNDVFRRHTSCTCTVVFIPVNGKAENAHSKYYIPDKELLELRKNYAGVDRSGGGGIIEGKGKGYLGENNKKPITVITDKAIDRVPYVAISGYSEEQCRKIQELHKELLHYSRVNNDNKEVAFVFDGNLMNRKEFKGTDDKLDFGSSLYGKDLFVMHNHPRNSSYSMNDVIEFITNDSIKTLTIVKNNGRTETLTKINSCDKVKLITDLGRIKKKNVKTGSDKELDKTVKDFLTKNAKGGIFEWQN